MYKTWLAVGDIHNSIGNIEKISNLSSIDGVIITGDLTFVGGIPDAERVLRAFAPICPVVAAQIGNMDKGEITEYFVDMEINSHGSVVELSEGVVLVGVGGSNITPFKTVSEFTEDELASLLESAYGAVPEHQFLILSSHTPPVNTTCDTLGNGAHAGSTAVREFIERVQPDICICGHIHEAAGVDKIGKTIVINPGAMSDGGFVRIEFDGKTLRAKLENLS